MKLLFITDSWRSLDHPRDTSLRLMHEALIQKCEVYWACYKNVSLIDSTPSVISHRLLKVTSSARSSQNFEFSEKMHLPAKWFHQIHYRVDPPVDAHYEYPLKILSFVPSVEKKIVNPIQTLLLGSEKLDGLKLSDYSPLTLISANERELKEFISTHKKVVLKPLNGAQSKGVSIITARDFGKVKKLSSDFDQAVVLQEYLPGVTHGETRLWFLDGRLLATIKKVPKKNQAIINIDQGSWLKKHTLTKFEKRAARAIGRVLKRSKIRMAAIDLIDGKITDFNVTSPGLIVQIEDLLGINLAKKIISALLK